MAILDNKEFIDSMKAVQNYMANNKPMPRFEKGIVEHLMSDNNSKVTISKETVKIDPKNKFQSFLVKIGILKVKTRSKSILIEYRPRIKE